MTELEANTFSSVLPIIVYRYQPGQHPSEWREVDRGPGIFHLDLTDQAVIRARNIDDRGVALLTQEIGARSWITFINLSENRKVTDEGVRLLAELKQITGLNLSSCSLNDGGLSYLSSLAHLQHLNLSFCNRITDVGLKHIRKLSRLTYLDLQGCVKVTQKGIALLDRRNLTIHH